MFDGVPDGLDLMAVRSMLLGLPGVADVYDLHVWTISISQLALTAHLVVDDAADQSNILCLAEEQLHVRHEIR